MLVPDAVDIDAGAVDLRLDRRVGREVPKRARRIQPLLLGTCSSEPYEGGDAARLCDGEAVGIIVVCEVLERASGVDLLMIRTRRGERDERRDAARVGDRDLVLCEVREVGERGRGVRLLRICARNRELD